MEFEKYSKQQFESLGINTPGARMLADELQDDVKAEIHAVILPAFLNVVERLNAQGHHLEKFDEARVGLHRSAMNRLTDNTISGLLVTR